MNNSKRRRRYTTEFKLEAIRLVKARGGRVTEVAKNLGIHPNMLHRWIKAHATDAEKAFPGNGNARDKELQRLQQKLRDVEEERDILKKALSIFSKPRQ